MTLQLHSLLLDLSATDGGAPVPSRIQLLPPSGFTGRDGRGPYTYDAQTLLNAFAAYGMPLPMDYEHQSIDAIDKTSPTPASGWITALHADASGVWGDVEWTTQAADYIGAKEYRFISPVFEAQRDGAIVQLIGAGLTNNPNLHLASLNSKTAAAGTYTHQLTPLSAHMKEQLLALFGLPADATDEQVLAAVKGAKDAEAHAKAAAEAVGASSTEEIVTAAQSKFSTDLSVYVAKTDFEAMSKRATDAETELAAHKSAAHKAEVAAVVEAAKTAGKLTPAQVAHAQELGEKDIELLRAFVGAAARVVDNKTVIDAHSREGEVVLTEAQLEMCRISGTKPEVFAKQLQAARK
ncbi:phage protease [Burkholderia pseudomallei]